MGKRKKTVAHNTSHGSRLGQRAIHWWHRSRKFGSRFEPFRQLQHRAAEPHIRSPLSNALAILDCDPRQVPLDGALRNLALGYIAPDYRRTRRRNRPSNTTDPWDRKV